MSDTFYKTQGLRIRHRILEMVAAADRGHIPSAFSIVEILLVLYYKILKLSPETANAADRDRLILSKGHGCLALYAVLSDRGFFSSDHCAHFCRLTGLLGGHPEHHIPGVEASTGALGHGLSLGMGIALNARIDQLDYRTYVILGDGECNEGSIWEAALSASKHQLRNLVVLIDYNKMQSYDRVEHVLPLEPLADKWRAFGFDTHELDMQHPEALTTLLQPHQTQGLQGQPLAIICHTIKGKGIHEIENQAAWHHKARFKAGDIERLKAALEAEA